MSALVLAHNRASYFELDYIPGSALPRSAAAADFVLSAFQAFSSLDTLTGAVPNVSLYELSPADSNAMAEWANATQFSFLDALKRADAGEPRDRVSSRASFEALNEWEGYVTSITDRDFTAHLLDLTAGSQSETDLATFCIDDVSKDDRELLEVGAIFRWSLGYERKVGGTVRKVSSLVFRRLPIWTARELSESRERARSVLHSITWE
jgi:hypothetical protein